MLYIRVRGNENYTKFNKGLSLIFYLDAVKKYRPEKTYNAIFMKL